MKLFNSRRARVRPEFAWLYPEIVPTVWMSANRAALIVKAVGRHAGADDPPARILPDQHFEFRGESRGRPQPEGTERRRSRPALS
jgi:hypothetical protein